MDGVDLWARTLAQLMARTKPQDTWELLAEDDLAAGRLDSTGYQYRLRGLSRLQCGRCQWGWASAHVHILFHLRWDPAARLGLVKMRVWGQRCQRCPPAAAECRVSLLNVRLFLGKLVLFILQRCYREGPGAGQSAEVCFGERCEACELGLCFFQRPPDPAWGPEAEPPGARKGGHALCRQVEWRPKVLKLSSCPGGPRAPRGAPRGPPGPPGPGAFGPRGVPAGGSSVLGEEAAVTVPFSLVGAAWPQGPRGDGLPAGLGGRLPISRGALYLPASSAAAPGPGLPISVREPVLQGRGRPGAEPFEAPGFVFRGRGALAAPAGAAPPVSYVVGLTGGGEGAITFPLAAAAALSRRAPRGEEEGGALTFPFRGDDGPAAGQAGVASAGAITLPCLVFEVMRRSGPLAEALAARYQRRRPRPRSRPPPPEPDFHRDDFCCGPGCCGPRSEAAEETWIWVSTILFILWVIYLHRVTPDTPQRF